jgi:two-component system, OmpR family, sensor kinase
VLSPRRMTLRLRLSMLAVVLVAAGLLAAGIATRYELRGFLVDRVDSQLQSAQTPVSLYFARGDTDQGAQGPVLGVLPPGSFAAVITGNSHVAASQYFGRGSAPEELQEAITSAPDGTSTHGDYRVYVTHGQAGDGSTPVRLVIAAPLHDVNSTLNRLVMLELLVGLIVLAVVAAIAFWLVRRELRPLVRIEDTAAAIAGGDLTQRVPEEAPGTEVGDLGRSLNVMLAQIEQAFEQRRQSEERLRRFVSDASHELRTPLTSVRGFAELFHRGAASRPDDLALAMSRIESEAERMGVIVEDLLLLANLDQGRPLGQEQFDLEAVLAEMVADHAMLHADWPISFSSSGGSDLVGDELRIRQAIANLLANARAHTPPGTGIAVALSTVGDDRSVEVSDNGPGIAADDLPHLFERFYRVDASRARRSGGSGLGLAIVQAIAEAHGGSVGVTSVEGEGAAFTIVLPIAGATEAARQDTGLASA